MNLTCPKIHKNGTHCGRPAGHKDRHGNGLLNDGKGWDDEDCKSLSEYPKKVSVPTCVEIIPPKRIERHKCLWCDGNGNMCILDLGHYPTTPHISLPEIEPGV